MVKWMYYLAVAMLLAAAADAAAVSVDVPAAVVDAGAVDVPAVAVDSSSVITLTKFLWTEATQEKTTVGTKYESLVITFEGVSAITSGTCSIVYKEAGKPEVNKDGTIADSECTILFDMVGGIDLPKDEIEYLLGVTDNTGEDHYTGSATFAVDPDDFNQGEPGAISCSGVSYTRTVVAKKKNCADLNGVGVELDATNYACYVPTTTGRSSESQTTDGNGCIGLPDSSGIQVCLSDKKFLGVADKSLTSLAVKSLNSEDGALDITYTDGTPDDTTLEVILQDSTDPAANKLLQVVKFDDSATTDITVTMDSYAQGLTTYDVCGVLSTTSDATHLVDVKTVETSGTITDLNVFMVEDDTAKLVEFGFNNARAGKDRKYYATLEDDAAAPVEVGINCVGVDQYHTCYGFLSTADLDGATSKTLTVGYGDTDAANFDDPANKIIGTVPLPGSQ